MNELNDFDERLRDARTKQGLEPKPKLQTGLPRGTWGIGFRVGVELVSSLMVGSAIGYALDHWLGTFPWLFLVFFLVGGAAGVLNVYRLFNPALGARKRDGL